MITESCQWTCYDKKQKKTTKGAVIWIQSRGKVKNGNNEKEKTD